LRIGETGIGHFPKNDVILLSQKDFSVRLSFQSSVHSDKCTRSGKTTYSRRKSDVFGYARFWFCPTNL